MIVSAPMNEIELRNLMYTAQQNNNGPFTIRYPRGKGVINNWKKEFELINAYVAGLNGLIVFVLLNAVDPPPIAAYSEITFPCCSPNKKIEYGDVLPICA